MRKLSLLVVLALSFFEGAEAAEKRTFTIGNGLDASSDYSIGAACLQSGGRDLPSALPIAGLPATDRQFIVRASAGAECLTSHYMFRVQQAPVSAVLQTNRGANSGEECPADIWIRHWGIDGRIEHAILEGAGTIAESAGLIEKERFVGYAHLGVLALSAARVVHGLYLLLSLDVDPEYFFQGKSQLVPLTPQDWSFASPLQIRTVPRFGKPDTMSTLPY